MEAISLAEAEARLSELIDRVEAGDSIDILRGDKPAARLAGVAKGRRRIDATMPPQAEDAADLVRSMRDGDRF